MEQPINEQVQVAPQTAEAEKVSGGGESASYGKFKDADALLSAYNSLEAEFTKRCQRIKELESKALDDKVIAPDEGKKKEDKGISDEDKNEILKDYLKSVLFAKQTAIVMDNAGVGVKTPADKPKSIAEAGNLAKSLF